MFPKISYFDLNGSEFSEDYSINPKRYGGGRIFASIAKEKISNFHIYAKSIGFENVTDKENKSNCHSVSQEQLNKIMSGEKVCEVIPECKNSDIFIHHNAQYSLNLDGCKTNNEAVWAIVCEGSYINPNIKNLIFYDFKHQKPSLQHNNHNIFHAVIGTKIEPFKEYKKEDLIFQCTRHNSCYQSIIVAQLCLKYNIKVIFAGIIENNYPLLKYIDNKTTHYIGIIDNNTKIKYNKISKFNTQFFQSYPISVTLSGKESLSYGTPIMATNIGAWPDFIQTGINGYIINSEQDFINAWNNRDNIKQFSCYQSVLPHSEDKMIESFSKAFEEIIKNP